jgi:hypothetical protein
VKGGPPPSPKLQVASSSIMVVKDDWVNGTPPPLCGCTSDTIIAEKGEDFRLTGLAQSQKWSVHFGQFGEVVVWDQGREIWDEEDGVSPFPLDAYFLDTSLDWLMDCEEDKDLSLAILEDIEEDYHRAVKVAHPKSKGKRELLNLKAPLTEDYHRSSLSFLSFMGPRRSKTSAQLALWVVSTRL